MNMTSMAALANVCIVAWEFALVDTGFGSEGFFFNSSGLQWTETEGGFSGWLGILSSPPVNILSDKH
jgi:hypothetical protein